MTLEITEVASLSQAIIQEVEKAAGSGEICYREEKHPGKNHGNFPDIRWSCTT
jgi:hypothetical protein